MVKNVVDSIYADIIQNYRLAQPFDCDESYIAFDGFFIVLDSFDNSVYVYLRKGSRCWTFVLLWVLCRPS